MPVEKVVGPLETDKIRGKELIAFTSVYKLAEIIFKMKFKNSVFENE